MRNAEFWERVKALSDKKMAEIIEKLWFKEPLEYDDNNYLLEYLLGVKPNG